MAKTDQKPKGKGVCCCTGCKVEKDEAGIQRSNGICLSLFKPFPFNLHSCLNLHEKTLCWSQRQSEVLSTTLSSRDAVSSAVLLPETYNFSHCKCSSKASLGAQWYRIHQRCRRCRFNPCVGKTLWRRKWQATPVFLPGKSHGQKSLAGYCPWGHKESDTTEHVRMRYYILYFLPSNNATGKEL